MSAESRLRASLTEPQDVALWILNRLIKTHLTIVPVYWCVLNLNGPKIKPLIAFVKIQLKHGSFTADLYVSAIYRLCIYNMLLIMSYI